MSKYAVYCEPIDTSDPRCTCAVECPDPACVIHPEVDGLALARQFAARFPELDPGPTKAEPGFFEMIHTCYEGQVTQVSWRSGEPMPAFTCQDCAESVNVHGADACAWGAPCGCESRARDHR